MKTSTPVGVEFTTEVGPRLVNQDGRNRSTASYRLSELTVASCSSVNVFVGLRVLGPSVVARAHATISVVATSAISRRTRTRFTEWVSAVGIERLKAGAPPAAGEALSVRLARHWDLRVARYQLQERQSRPACLASAARCAIAKIRAAVSRSRLIARGTTSVSSFRS